MEKKEFAAAALNLGYETFVVYITSLSSTPLDGKPQISGLIAKKASTKVPAKYSDFADVFFPDLVSKLPKHTRINDHAIELVNSQQPPHKLIYSLGLVEFETLKAYIETNLANRFIRPSKSPAGAPILFDRKPDGFLQLCINYQGLNNFTIKNRYPLPLIGESLDRLRKTKRFTQLDLTSVYHRMRIREGVKWKTTFKTWYGYFQYQVISFGLTNTPSSFQGFINKILAKKLDIFVIIYLDDIFIYTDDDRDSHVITVWWILEQLRKFSLFANLKKYWFHQDEVWFLGYVVSSKGIRIEDERIEAIKQWPKP